MIRRQDVAGVLTGSIVGVVSAFLAWRAVRIGRQANEAAVKAAEEAERANMEASKARAAVARERRRTFDLEILRELLRSFDVRVRRSGGYVQGGGRMPDWESTLSVAEIIDREDVRLSLLPADELNTWRDLADFRLDPDNEQHDWEEKIMATAHDDPEFNTTDDPYHSAIGQALDHVKLLMRQQVLAAIRARVQARDD